MCGDHIAQSRTTRRLAIEAFLGGGVLASLAAFLHPVLRFLVPPSDVDLSGDEVVAGKVPELRSDQLAEYHTSVHGKRLAAADTKIAVCIDCHSVHDISPPNNPRSTANLPSTWPQPARAATRTRIT